MGRRGFGVGVVCLQARRAASGGTNTADMWSCTSRLLNHGTVGAYCCSYPACGTMPWQLAWLKLHTVCWILRWVSQLQKSSHPSSMRRHRNPKTRILHRQELEQSFQMPPSLNKFIILSKQEIAVQAWNLCSGAQWTERKWPCTPASALRSSLPCGPHTPHCSLG
jgi:hypothetical protein